MSCPYVALRVVIATLPLSACRLSLAILREYNAARDVLLKAGMEVGAPPVANLDYEDVMQLLRKGESDRVEFKESLRGDAPNRIREAICALLMIYPTTASQGLYSWACGMMALLPACRSQMSYSGNWRI